MNNLSEFLIVYLFVTIFAKVIDYEIAIKIERYFLIDTRVAYDLFEIILNKKQKKTNSLYKINFNM